jgi:hypothetical protein
MTLELLLSPARPRGLTAHEPWHGVGRRNERAPEAEHVAPSASLHKTTRADRRRGQGGWVAEALTPSSIGAIRRERRRRSGVRIPTQSRATAPWLCGGPTPQRAGRRWGPGGGSAGQSGARRGESEGARVGVKRTLAALRDAAETPEAASTRGPRPLAMSAICAGTGGGTRGHDEPRA